MQPPRNGALPYTREDYCKLPADQRNAALDFMIEGIIPNMHGTSYALQRAKGDMRNIVNWCIAHGEYAALEFLYRESGTREMCISGRVLNQRELMSLRSILQHHPQVQVFLGDVIIRDGAAGDLADLIRNQRIAELRIECGSLTNASMSLIALALASDSIITDVHLRGCKSLTSEVAGTLGAALGKHVKIGTLHFSFCDFGAEGWKPLFEGLQSNRHAQHLAMQYCSLESHGSAAALGELLATSTTLKKVSLWIREFDRSAGAILGGLGQSRSIEEAMIAACYTSLDCMEPALSECIARNSSLKRLEFAATSTRSSSGGHEKFVMKGTDAVVSNTTLLALPDVYALGTSEQRIAEDALERNKALASDKFMSDAGAVFSELPFASPSWLPEGPSDTLAGHILKLERSIPDFANAMAHVDLAVKEQSRQAADHAAQ